MKYKYQKYTKNRKIKTISNMLKTIEKDCYNR